MAQKPGPNFPEMPWHVKQAIVARTTMDTQFNLRTCSKELKTLVDKVPIAYWDLKILLYASKLELFMTRQSDQGPVKMDVTFEKDGEKTTIVKTGAVNHRVTVPGDFLEMAFEFLGKIFFKKPRNLVKICKMDLKLNDGNVRKQDFIQKLQKFTLEGGQLQARWLVLNMSIIEKDLCSVIRNFQPKNLKCLHLWTKNTIPFNQSLTEVAVLPHWRQIVNFGFFGFCLDLPYEDWKHFHFNFGLIGKLNLADYRDIIERFNNTTNWQRASYSIVETSEDLEEYILSLEKKNPEKDDRELSMNTPDGKTTVMSFMFDTMNDCMLLHKLNRRNQ